MKHGEPSLSDVRKTEMSAIWRLVSIDTRPAVTVVRRSGRPGPARPLCAVVPAAQRASIGEGMVRLGGLCPNTRVTKTQRPMTQYLQ